MTDAPRTTETLRAAITALSTANDPGAVLFEAIDPIVALLREAADYSTDWDRDSQRRGYDPSSVYRKEIRLAQVILGAVK